MSLLDRIFKRGGKTTATIIPNYPLLIATCKIDDERVTTCNNIVKDFYLPNISRYVEVSKKTSVPAWAIFCIHYKEASCRFDGALHNGDRVIGNGKKTYNVPKGRGPFKIWEESAIDSLILEKNKFPMVWDNIPMTLEFFEKYNGLGHRKHGELSPYIWAYTNQHDETGNYVSDGKYNSEAKIKSAGIAALILTMNSMNLIRLTDDRKYLLPV